jgi:hypothetical protein
MDRITDKTLKSLCESLNSIKGTPQEAYSLQADGSYRANVGNYHLDFAYGGVMLVKMSNESGGVSNVLHTGHVTRRELYNLMHAYIKGLEDSK